MSILGPSPGPMHRSTCRPKLLVELLLRARLRRAPQYRLRRRMRKSKSNRRYEKRTRLHRYTQTRRRPRHSYHTQCRAGGESGGKRRWSTIYTVCLIRHILESGRSNERMTQTNLESLHQSLGDHSHPPTLAVCRYDELCVFGSHECRKQRDHWLSLWLVGAEGSAGLCGG